MENSDHKSAHAPAVVATVLEHEAEDVRTLKLSYTGTTQEAEAQRNEHRASRQLPQGTIHDYTGSGRENVPVPPTEEANSLVSHPSKTWFP